MHECVICQHTGTCTWQILMNETHVCNITYRHLSVLFCCIREFFVCLHTFRKEKEIIMAIFIELFLLGVGLSMDAFAVSVCKGLGMRKLNKTLLSDCILEDFRHLCRSSAGFLAASSRSTSPALTTGSHLSFLVSSAAK